MPLLTLNQASLAFGHVPLLDRAEFSLDAGERVALIGRNGAGKSSLFGVLTGSGALDDGEAWKKPGLRLSAVSQEPQFEAGATVYEAVVAGLEAHAFATEYERLSNAANPDLARMAVLEEALSDSNGWDVSHRVDRVLATLSLDANQQVDAASGGMKKRVALARALVAEPEVLLLDEPTNHLDITSIAWLEELLLEFRGALLFITHDRAFLDRVATRIVELDRGRLLSFPGNFSAYQTRKAEQIEIEKVVNAKFDKFLAQEEVWIRKGVEARRTRNEGRVLRLEQLRRDRVARRERQGQVSLAIDDSSRSGKLVAAVETISHRFGERPLVESLTLNLMRGDKLGLIGPNGSGKTTLIRLILGQLAPQAGVVKLGSNLEVAYFDQFRLALNESATLADTISPGSDWVETAGGRKHVMSYLGDFLFPPERAQAKVSSLSGGERNRLLLARLFARPANLLVLDEPTNDLDIDTLELLESLLQDYQGTLILVSHDRVFLDNVVTQVLVHDGDGRWVENPGGYSEWQAYLARRLESAKASVSSGGAPEKAQPSTVSKASPQKKKLNFNESRELAALPEKIRALEEEQTRLNAALADPATYQATGTDVGAMNARVAVIEEELMHALERWDALEAAR